MLKKIISVLLTVTIISGFVITGRDVKAAEVDYANVTVDQLLKMKDKPEELENVHGFNVSSEKNSKKIEEAIQLLAK